MELFYHRVDLVFNRVLIHHGILAVMVMPVSGAVRMMMDKRALLCIFIVVGHSVHQDLQSCPFPCRYGNGGDPQHFRQSVQIDLHPPLFHHIHHIERQHHRLPQLDQLQGQIKISLQAGRVCHVNNDIHLIAHNTLS